MCVLTGEECIISNGVIRDEAEEEIFVALAQAGVGGGARCALHACRSGGQPQRPTGILKLGTEKAEEVESDLPSRVINRDCPYPPKGVPDVVPPR